jgi:hypothetical protein
MRVRAGRPEHAASLLVGYDSTMADFGKVLIVLGGALLAVGIVLVLLGRTNLPVGRLPGDLIYRGKNTTVYFPLATSLLLSVLLSVVLYVLGRWRR